MLHAGARLRGHLNDGSSHVEGLTRKYRDEVDAALILAEVVGCGAQNNYRTRWNPVLGNTCA